MKDLFLFAFRNADYFISLAPLPSVRVEEVSTPATVKGGLQEFKGACVWGGWDLLFS